MTDFRLADFDLTWQILGDYDEALLTLPSPGMPVTQTLTVGRARQMIDTLRDHLIGKGQVGALFGASRDGLDEGLSAIIGNIEQVVFGETLYPSVESRAAHLLYFVIKDHPLVDGNKRSAALLMMQYLADQGYGCALTPAALASVTLFIAQSSAQDKERNIALVAQLIAA